MGKVSWMSVVAFVAVFSAMVLTLVDQTSDALVVAVLSTTFAVMSLRE